MMVKQLEKDLKKIIQTGLLLGGLAGPALSTAAELNWLEVHVLNKQTGAVVSDAAVCLGTSARPDQFGAIRTDSRGIVRFSELLPNPLLLTVSNRGYQGQQQLLEPLYQNRVLTVNIVPGGGGPQCEASAAPVSREVSAGLSIETVKIKPDTAAGGSSVLVSVAVSGPANQIRISEQADFSDASWQKLTSDVSHTLSEGKGVKRIYVQVRRLAQVEGASIEVLSATEKAQYRRR